jgi:secondary thiamine-phosphate synthase enzyme
MLCKISVTTLKRIEFIDITSQVKDLIKKENIRNGIAIIYTPHTTAAITINENADPSVKYDINEYLSKTIPYRAGYTHLEGNSDAHIKSSIIGCSEQVIVENGSLLLGTWQGIFFCEFDGPRHRKVFLKILSV